MKHFAIILGAVLLFSACSQGSPVISVQSGQLQGVDNPETGVTTFKGVPYAAPPVGDLRWKAPQPPSPWEGVRLADTFGDEAYQGTQRPGSFYWKEFYSGGTPQSSEDCLYLNVYAPTGTVGKKNAKLPVAMWIHGGAYMGGYGYEITMDTESWAQRGVILVTINYRVGMLGFLSHPDLTAESGHPSGNYGLLDQIAALKWIHENIRSFGGAPDNITVFGQSAGALSVKNLLISPLSKDLIAKAIIQSGGGIGKTGLAPDDDIPVETFDSQGKELMDAAGLTTLEAMRSLSAKDLDETIRRSGGRTFGLFAPHNDGYSIVSDFDASVYQRRIADIPILIGYNGHDMAQLSGDCVDLFCQVRDSLGTAPVYEYEFLRDLPGDDDEPEHENSGAFHSAELWYMFHTLDRCWRPFTEGDYALADQMTDAWTSFCKTGNPGWQAYSAGHPFKQLFDVK